MVRLWLFVVGWHIVSVAPFFAQNTPYFIRFSTTEGLPSNNVGPMANDPDGFLWVGTRNGLARFDGQRFVPFNHLSPKSRLPDENVQALVADRRGYLWVQFPKQLFRLSLATFRVEEMKENLMPQCVDDGGNVYFIGGDAISVFQEKECNFRAIPLQWAGKTGKATMARRGKNGLILVLTDIGLFRVDPQKNTCYPLLGLGPVQNILVMASDEHGNLWLSRWTSPENGVIHYDPYADKVLRTFSKDKGGFSDTDLNGITPNGDNVWFATNTGGLCRYVASENRVHCYPAVPEKPGHFWSNQTARCHIDFYGNLWVSSPIFLYKCPARLAVTALLKHDPLQANSLISPQCINIVPIAPDVMVFGTMAGLSLYNKRTSRFLNVRLPDYSAYNNQITALAQAENGGFWVASWTGLYRLDGQNGRILSYFITNTNSKAAHPESLKRFNVGPVRRMCKDRDGVLWVASFGNKIARLDEKSPKPDIVPVVTLVSDSFPLNDRAEAFLDWNERYFLIGTLDGLVRLDRAAQRFEVCPLVFPGIVRPAKIESLARSKNGDILCIVNGKPFRVTWTGNEAQAKPIGVPNDVVQAHHFVEDVLGKIWITTENGLVQHDPQTGNSLFYDSHNYLNDNLLLLRPTVVPAQDQDGNLYFGGSRGVSVLRPGDFVVRQHQIPPVKIIDLSINGQRAELDSAVHRLKSLRLPHSQNSLAFAFAALNSTVPQRNSFAYRLNEGAWEALGTQNTVNFSQLAPGGYVLQVKAANSDGVWNEVGTQLQITIDPPWWRTWAAYMVYAGLIGYALYRYLLFRENRLQMAHQLETERKEAERLQELDHFKNRFFANISHEFRTPLTVILGMSAQRTGHDGQAAAKYDTKHGSTDAPLVRDRESDHIVVTARSMNMIHRNGQNLLRLINQILDLAKMEEGKLTLQPEQADIVAFSRYVVESLHSLSEMKGVRLHFETETDVLWMDFDLEKMQSILFNLLSNALKFTSNGGNIYLKIGQMERSGSAVCRITVRDTGIGISPDKIGRIFDRFFRIEDPATRQIEGVGIGLAFTRELVRLMGGEIGVESTVGMGSTFEILVPIIRERPVRSTTEMKQSISTHEVGYWSDVSHLHLPIDAEADAQPFEAGTAAARPTVLLVEDNDDVRQYLVACLADRYHILQALNGREGIEMALEHTPDLILSDVMMPEKDGFELCQTLKNDARSSHIPIVLLTAKASVESRIAGLSRGADAYLPKPFHQEELLLTLNNLLQSRRVLQERLRATLLVAQTATSIEEKSLTMAPEALAALEVEDIFVQKIRRYVEENINNANLSMSDLSRAMTMSYQNLHRKLSALTNLSPVQFIRTVRLQKAILLLQTTPLPIGDIAFEVGFEDPKYFSRVFTEEFGRPPSAVR